MLAPHRRVIAPIPEQPPPPVPYPNDVAQGPAPAESDSVHTLPLPEPADKEEDETTVTFSKERMAMEPLRNYVKDYAVFGRRKRMDYLRNALVHGHDDVARLLLSHGADPDCGHYRTGVTPLHDCARENLASGIRILLTADAEIDPATKNGTTPLMRAAVGGHCDVIRLLLREGADLALVDAAGDDAGRREKPHRNWPTTFVSGADTSAARFREHAFPTSAQGPSAQHARTGTTRTFELPEPSKAVARRPSSRSRCFRASQAASDTGGSRQAG
ncbi:hypothetical protein JL722_5354 [Aureococcus anophagefferens]|nr:hypothetical protein JL722_5354 [Aureococcus anophagefferens]